MKAACQDSFPVDVGSMGVKVVASFGARGVAGFPVETTSFVDRRDELAEVRRLLSVGRLLTLTGAAGVGKTRLAVRLAERLSKRLHRGFVVHHLFAVHAWLQRPGHVGRHPHPRPAFATGAVKFGGVRRDLTLLVEGAVRQVDGRIAFDHQLAAVQGGFHMTAAAIHPCHRIVVAEITGVQDALSNCMPLCTRQGTPLSANAGCRQVFRSD